MSQSTKNKKLAIAAIAGAIVVSFLVMYFAPLQKQVTMIPATQEDTERSEALGVAQRYVVTSPTFAFDGDINSLKTEYVGSTKSIPPQHLFKASFDSSHGGYGNREGQMLTQVITPHTVQIIVSEGSVISAVTDEAWDELTELFVSRPSKLPATDDVSSFDGKVVDYPTFVNALEHRGVLVEKVDILDDSAFSVPTIVLKVGGVDVQVYEFASEDAAQTASMIVSEDGTEIGTSIIRWIDTPHFYMQGKIIVQYIGQNPEILNLLDSLLGNQFAGM